MLSGIGAAGRAARGRRRAAPRAARRRPEPPGPPVPDDALGGLRGPTPLRRRQAEVPARVAAAPQRAADLDRRRGRSPSSAPGPGCPPPTSSSTWAPLYFEDHGEEEFDGHAMTIAPVLVSPQARGQVWLRSADPPAKPRILTNSLAEPEDVASMVAGMRARRARSPPPRRWPRSSSASSSPAPRRRTATSSRPTLRRRLELIYHPVGTCRMSDDGRRRGRRLRAARARDRGPARRRRLGLPGDPRRQHATRRRSWSPSAPRT